MRDWQARNTLPQRLRESERRDRKKLCLLSSTLSKGWQTNATSRWRNSLVRMGFPLHHPLDTLSSLPHPSGVHSSEVLPHRVERSETLSLEEALALSSSATASMLVGRLRHLLPS